MLQTKIVVGIEEIASEAWNKLTSGYPFAAWDWFRFGERVLDARGTYILVCDGDQIIGGAAFFTLYQEQLIVKSRLAQRFWEMLLARYPLIVCRTAPLTRSKALFVPGDDARVLPLITAEALKLARKHRTSMILFDYLRSADVDDASWGGYFLKIRDFTEPGTRMALSWDTFEDYLASLTSAWRRSYRRNMKHIEEEGILLKTHSQIVHLEEALALMRNVERNHNQHPEPHTSQVLANLDTGAFTWFTAHIQDRLVGCCLMLEDRSTSTCQPVLLGLDYAARYAYFAIMYGMIRYAIEQSSAAVLWGGSDAYDFKLAFGFEKDYQNNMVLASPSTWLQRVIGRLM